MFRFTIRELILLTIIAGMGVAWWLREYNAQSADWENKANTLKYMVEQDGYQVKWHNKCVELTQPGKDWSSLLTYGVGDP